MSMFDVREDCDENPARHKNSKNISGVSVFVI